MAAFTALYSDLKIEFYLEIQYVKDILRQSFIYPFV